jgi:hypothetical protein
LTANHTCTIATCVPPFAHTCIRCISVGLSTGVDVVLSDVYASYDTAAYTHIPTIPREEVHRLMHNVQLPPSQATEADAA